jgi:hypothetical protein
MDAISENVLKLRELLFSPLRDCSDAISCQSPILSYVQRGGVCVSNHIHELCPTITPADRDIMKEFMEGEGVYNAAAHTVTSFRQKHSHSILLVTAATQELCALLSTSECVREGMLYKLGIREARCPS